MAKGGDARSRERPVRGASTTSYQTRAIDHKNPPFVSLTLLARVMMTPDCARVGLLHRWPENVTTTKGDERCHPIVAFKQVEGRRREMQIRGFRTFLIHLDRRGEVASEVQRLKKYLLNSISDVLFAHVLFLSPKQQEFMGKNLSLLPSISRPS